MDTNMNRDTPIATYSEKNDGNERESIYVTRPFLPPIEEYMQEIAPLWDSHMLTNCGVLHQKFESQLKKYLHTAHLALMTNGHLALELILQALLLSGEVITTPFTFASTTHAIVRSGLKPVFCDIRERDFTMDPTCIEACITEKTTAILPVHVYGNVCDIEAIQAIADKHKLKVIYDAAHTFGETLNGRSVAGYGDASILSFHATKVFHSIEGGAVVCHSQEVEQALLRLRNFGICSEEHVEVAGTNAKMDEFRAAMGLCSLRHVEEEIKKRKEIFECYLEHLKGVAEITLPGDKTEDDFRPNYAYFPIIMKDETSCESLYDLLRQNGIRARRYFYPLTSRFECYRNTFSAGQTPVADRISRRVLTLPIYAGLTVLQVERICSFINR